MNKEKIELPESNTKNRFDELLEKFEISKSEMTKEELQGFAKAVLKYASSNERANEYIDQLLADILEKEEYERLLEKAEELDVEEVKLEVGGYYSKESTIYEINKLGGKSDLISAYTEPSDFVRNVTVSIADGFVKSLRKATDEEIKLFKRAEMYHKHGRKLGELKVGDLVKTNYSGFQFALKSTLEVELWSQTGTKSANNVEIYLTVEEQQEAHKKIVGE